MKGVVKRTLSAPAARCEKDGAPNRRSKLKLAPQLIMQVTTSESTQVLCPRLIQHRTTRDFGHAGVPSTTQKQSTRQNSRAYAGNSCPYLPTLHRSVRHYMQFVVHTIFRTPPGPRNQNSHSPLKAQQPPTQSTTAALISASTITHARPFHTFLLRRDITGVWQSQFLLPVTLVVEDDITTRAPIVF